MLKVRARPNASREDDATGFPRPGWTHERETTSEPACGSPGLAGGINQTKFCEIALSLRGDWVLFKAVVSVMGTARKPEALNPVP